MNSGTKIFINAISSFVQKQKQKQKVAENEPNVRSKSLGSKP